MKVVGNHVRVIVNNPNSSWPLNNKPVFMSFNNPISWNKRRTRRPQFNLSRWPVCPLSCASRPFTPHSINSLSHTLTPGQADGRRASQPHTNNRNSKWVSCMHMALVSTWPVWKVSPYSHQSSQLLPTEEVFVGAVGGGQQRGSVNKYSLEGVKASKMAFVSRGQVPTKLRIAQYNLFFLSDEDIVALQKAGNLWCFQEAICYFGFLLYSRPYKKTRGKTHIWATSK